MLVPIASAGAYSRVSVVTGNRSSDVELRAARLLADRIAERSAVRVAVADGVADDTRSGEHLSILIGVPTDHDLLAERCRALKINPPDDLDPGAEGFVLRTVHGQSGDEILAAATDPRGTLFAAGEILRQLIDTDSGVYLAGDLNIRTAPAFRLRGTEVSQGHTMKQLTQARDWTYDEWRRVVLDYALAGANSFGGGHVAPIGETSYDFMRSYGLKTLTSLSPNGGSGPPEWQATEAIGRTGHLCLSVPAARASILESVETRYKNGRFHDYLRMYSGDGGGCECDKCAPYGKTYIEMCADIAAIVHKYHPETEIFATNQKLDNAGDQAIFDYFNERPRTWLSALCIGPGSNAMSWQPGRRQDHRLDLFRYPAFGPVDRYFREMLHQLPPNQSLVFFTDLTHWVYSEYGLVNYEPIPDRDGHTPPHWGSWVYHRNPDPALDAVYNRRTFHARPRHYHHIFQETMRYGEGDLTYSEGHHDHFNQWMWQRLLWNPHMSVEAVVAEYARVWFGPEAAPHMTEAIFQLEENLSASLATNDGIDRFYLVVRKAGWAMPERKMKTNYLWRQYMQKAALDKYIQLRLRRQRALVEGIEEQLAAALQTGELESAVAYAQAALADDIESAEMKRLKDEAGRLGTESAALFGVRNTGYFNLDQDFVGLGWLGKQVALAGQASPERRREIVNQVVFYEDPGEGGYYDDAGDPRRAPHLTFGWPFSDGGISGANRPSQRRLAFTTDEQQGVTFEYDDLDPTAHYRVRFTLVRPRYLPRFGVRQKQTSQSIYADDALLVKDLELPQYMCDFFEYDIPKTTTADGKLTIMFKKADGVGEEPHPEITVWRNTGGWGTLVSEVWLMKRK
jgi:hypothetical protein